MCEFKYKVYDINDDDVEVFKSEYTDPKKALTYGRFLATMKGAMVSIKGKSDDLLMYTVQGDDGIDHLVLKKGETGEQIQGNRSRLAIAFLEES